MKEYRRAHPNPEDDHRPEWEKKLRPPFSASEDKHGEGARPSSLIPVHRPALIDPLHEMNLLRMMQVANERSLRELGPLPPGGLPVQKKRKPKTPYTDFRGRIVSAEPIIEENDEMKLKDMTVAAGLVAGILTCDPAASAAAEGFNIATEAFAQEQGTPSPGDKQSDDYQDLPKTYWQTFKPEFRASFDAQWEAAKTDEEKLASIKEELAYQDSILNVRYKELHGMLPTKEWEFLRDEQREWLTEVIKVCDEIITERLESANCRLFRTAVRASELDVEIRLNRHRH